MAENNQSIYDFIVKDKQGNDVSLRQYQGQVLLIVNTATGCGFTPQYKGLEALYSQFKERGFTILDFPCNQFGHQAPGTDEEIHTFCTLHYGVTFPQFKKLEVNGRNAEPLFQYLKSQKKGLGGSNIKWNFTKFLVDRQGNVVARYAPNKTPESLAEEIGRLLQEK